MKLVQKVLFSLLLATVVFTGFAVAAYSGLFRVIDEQFYNQRVRESSRAILEEARNEAQRYHATLLEDVGELAGLSAMRNVFLINQSRQDTEEQAQAIGRFFEEYPETDYIRVVDRNGDNLWFSTLDADVRERGSTRIEYAPVSELDPPLLLPSPDADGPDVSWIPERRGARVTAPIIDSFGIPQGLIVVWVNTNGLFSALVSEGIVGPATRIRLTPEGALVFNAPRHFEEEDLVVLDEHIAEERSDILESDIGAGFAVENLPPRDGLPSSAYLIPESDLHMNDSLRWILLGAVFLVTFLLAYLILNIRQDPDVIVAERFRRFQQAILRDYLREGRAIAPDLWQRELDGRKEKIERELRKGLGKLNDETRSRLEQNMERNWNELYQLMGSGGGTSRAELEPVSLQQIEAIIERTLARYGEFGTTRPAAPASETAPPARKRAAPPPEAVEEPAEEPVDELEEIEEAELVDELEEIEEAEPVDELEEIEEVPEAEAVLDEL
ncbi:MAG: hypothetical protein ACOC2V_06060, partial [Alkalispirochaeta sp.]